MRYLTAFFWLLLIVIMTTFVVLNSQQVIFNYYFGELKIYLPLLFFIFLLFGILIGMVSVLPSWWRGKRRIRFYHTQVLSLEKELQSLRSLPVRDMEK
jgi:uncharacterized integral membrane protein